MNECANDSFQRRGCNTRCAKWFPEYEGLLRSITHGPSGEFDADLAMVHWSVTGAVTIIASCAAIIITYERFFRWRWFASRKQTSVGALAVSSGNPGKRVDSFDATPRTGCGDNDLVICINLVLENCRRSLAVIGDWRCMCRLIQGFMSYRALTWDEYFMGIAILSSLRSKDPSKQVL